MTKAIIEDYNGNTISELPIKLSYSEMHKDSFNSIHNLPFSVADVDNDNEGNECIRFQYVIEGEVSEQDIITLINNLN